MSKLTLDALKERADAVASEDLLNTISGGTENSCHPSNGGSAAYNDGVAKHSLLSDLGDTIMSWFE